MSEIDWACVINCIDVNTLLKEQRKRKKKERMKIKQKGEKITLVNKRSLSFCGNQSTYLIYRYEGSKCTYINTQSRT